MKDDALSTCSGCGDSLSPSTLDGLCPKCVSKLILAAAPADEIAAAQTAAVPSSRNFGQYELLEEIARGGMGVVFKARQRSLNRIVALKMILTGQFAGVPDVKRFRAEAEAVAQLQHPNIVSIHEIGDHEGFQFFSMDYIEGVNLAELVRRGTLPAKRAAAYLKTVAVAIHYAHRQGIIHRDLKPSNILIDATDQPRVTDFGLAKRLADSADPDAQLTVTGQVLGTPAFIPPEQAGGKRGEVGPRSDIYSLGAVLYFMLTGQPPFAGASLSEILSQVVHQPPVPPRKINPAVPRDLETICLKCLEKEPGRRYASAQKLADDLDRFLRDEPITSRPVTVVEKFWRLGRRHPAVATLAAGLIITCLVLLAVLNSADFHRGTVTLPATPKRITMEPPPILFEMDGATLTSTIIGPGTAPAVDPKNNHLWNATSDAGGVVVRDGDTDIVLTNITLAGCPGDVAVDSIHRLVWVTAQCGHGDDSVWAINADTFSIVAGPIHSGGIVVGPIVVNPATGRFYFPIQHAAGLWQLRIEPANLRLTKTGLGSMRAANSAANLLYACRSDGGLRIIDGALDPEVILTNIALPFLPFDGLFDVNPVLNRVYVPQKNSNTILVLDARSGRAIDTLNLQPKFGEITSVKGVAVDSIRNRLYAIAATGTGAFYLYVIENGVQTAISISTGSCGPVINPALNKVYFWVTPLPIANPQ